MTLAAEQPFLDAWRVNHLVEPGACRKVLFLGEDNPQSSDPFFALYPAPERCAGDRLCNYILRMPEDNYLACWRTNLCHDGPWNLRRARARADVLLGQHTPWGVIVVLGAKVAKIAGKCVGIELEPFKAYETMSGYIVYLPHPSGRNLVWNSRDMREKARDLLWSLVPDLWPPRESWTS